MHQVPLALEVYFCYHRVFASWILQSRLFSVYLALWNHLFLVDDHVLDLDVLGLDLLIFVALESDLGVQSSSRHHVENRIVYLSSDLVVGNFHDLCLGLYPGLCVVSV